MSNTRTRSRKSPARNREAAPPRGTPAAHSFRPSWLAIALAAATLIAYAPAVTAPFVFDDVPSIERNVSIRQLWPASIPLHPPKGDLAVSGRPVVNYTLAVNYAINARLGVDQRPDPDGPYKTLGYHLVNILLHLACGLVLLGLVGRTISHGHLDERWVPAADRIAALVTAVWLLHPIQTEAVNYVVQRTELLVSLCYLGTLYASSRAWDAQAKRAALRWRAVAVIVCGIGMGSKEVMITAPLAVMLYDRAFKLRSWRALADRNGGQRWLYVMLATTSALCIALVASGPRSATVGFHLGVTWYEYLYSQAWAIAHYLRLAFWPSGLTLDYGEEMIRGWAGLPGLGLLAACGAATILAWARIDRWGWFAFTGALFFLLLAPSSSVVPIASEVAAERRIYLAFACVAIVVVVAADVLVRRWRTRSKPRRPQSSGAGVPAWAAIVVAALLGVLTFQRSREYAQPERLWREVVASTPANPRGYDGVAYVMLHERPPRVAEAIPFLRQALALDSTYLSPMRALAAIAVHQSRLAEARPLLQRELALDPNYADARPLLGIVLVALGKPDSAAAYLAHVDLDPLAEDDPTGETLTALGTTYMIVGRWADAASAFRRTLEVNPGKTDAKEFLGDALIREGRPAEAVPVLEEAERSGTGSAFGAALLSLADAQTGNVQGSTEAAAAAAARGGSEPLVYVLAGRASLLTAHAAEAESYFARALRLSSGDPEVITGLGSAEAALGKRAIAEQLYRRALAIQPDYAPAQRALRDLSIPPNPKAPRTR